jgi:3-keto-5-aminohexanoate cleavage enzyme
VTGGRASGAGNPHHPRTPEEIGRAAVEAWREGAAIVHIHARNDHGEPTADLDCFGRIVDTIRSSGSDVVINLTTSFADDPSQWEQRFGPLELGPELASFDCGTLNFNDHVFHNAPDFLEALAGRMLERSVKPEIEIFDAGMIATAQRLAAAGLLEEPLYFQFVLGVQGGAPATERDLLFLVESIPPGAPWSVCALGRGQLPMNAMAIAMGGHARTGLEDNLFLRKGEFASNGQLVERVRRLAQLMEREVATPQDARRILHLRAPQAVHGAS